MHKKTCEFCKKEVPEQHENCPQELESRLIVWHGIGTNVMAKAEVLKNTYLRNNIPETRKAIEDLLNAIDPMHMASGNHFAKLVCEQLDHAHELATIAADDERHHELGGAINKYRKHRRERGTDAIDYIRNGRRERNA